MTLTYPADQEAGSYRQKMAKMAELKAAGWKVVAVTPYRWGTDRGCTTVQEMHVLLSK